MNPIDKRGRLSTGVFDYKVTKDRRVFISWHGKTVTTLSGAKAEEFIEDIEGLDGAESQLVMAKATGNFKRGNERH